jgi:hypothetical protein
MKLTDITEKKSTISVRVNEHIIEKFKQNEIPLSVVVEASMIKFLKMEEVERIKFIADNIPENVETNSFKKIDEKWNDVLGKYTKNMGLPQSVMTSIFAGAAVGAVTLIAAAFNISKLIDDEK